MFQSAPLTEARGDWLGSKFTHKTSSFNPLPSPKQGETRILGGLLLQAEVSIRSPHRSKGRPPELSLITRHQLFQSAPLTEARGDTFRLAKTFRLVSFNPLPSPKQGETFIKVNAHTNAHVSIRSPHRSKGRPQSSGAGGVQYWFQSAPLTEARGDLPEPLPVQIYTVFQSAPLTEARGDLVVVIDHIDAYAVSIRSPHRSKGRLH